MWREPAVPGPDATPHRHPADWRHHGRFLTDLLTFKCPEAVLDLSHDGSGAAAVQAIAPTVRVIVAHAKTRADLVLVDEVLPDLESVADGGLALVSDWDGAGVCPEPHAVLANGLTIIAPQGQRRWAWLLSDDFIRWSTVYRPEISTDELEFLRQQMLDLNDSLKAQTELVEIAERELLRARDEVQQLLPLEVSPKAQLRALSRSVPVSVRKRLVSYRRERTRKVARRQDSQLLRLKNRTLRELLSRHYDTQWAGAELTAYYDSGLPLGTPVNPEHDRRLNYSGEAIMQEDAREWTPSTLVSPVGRVVGSVSELVEAAQPRLITVDVWDTLVVRRRPADAAKLASARRMVLMPGPDGTSLTVGAFEAMATRVAVEKDIAAADPGQEYELTHVLRETLSSLWHMPVTEVAGIADALAEAEVADEIRWTESRADVGALVRMPNLAIASDFYMRTAHLARVVHAAAPEWADVPVYVSVDRKCSKRLGGGLLDLIRRDYNVTAQEHLHVGDNVHSDIDVQVAAGGMAIHVQRRDEFPAPGEFSEADLPACSAALRGQLSVFDRDNPTQDQHELTGRAAAPLAVAVVARGLEQAYRAGVDRVHYVSREGIFLAQVHELVEPLLRPPGVPAVAAVHLALSRRATFGASMQAPFRFSLQRMWSMYANQSVRAMLISIGVDPAELEPAIARAGLTPDELLVDARKDRRVEAFLTDPDVEARIHEHVEGARSLLRRYVTSRTTLREPLVVVDIGWRGTIQDNLVRALGIRSSIGVYLGLFPFLNAQPVGSRKIGVAFDGNLGEDFEFCDPPAVLERPWTPDVPSTVGFREQDGEVVPVLDKEPGHVSSGIAAFQAGTLAVAPLVARWMDGFGLTTDALRPEISNWAKELWENPLPGLADIWFASDHDDSFGALNVSEFGKETPSAQWLDGDLYEHVTAGMAASGWSDGYRAWRPVQSIIELANL